MCADPWFDPRSRLSLLGLSRSPSVLPIIRCFNVCGSQISTRLSYCIHPEKYVC